MKSLLLMTIMFTLIGCSSTSKIYTPVQNKKHNPTLSEGANLLLHSGQMSPLQFALAVNGEDPAKGIGRSSMLRDGIEFSALTSLGASPLEALGVMILDTKSKYNWNFRTYGILVDNPSKTWANDYLSILLNMTGTTMGGGEISVYDDTKTNELKQTIRIKKVYVKRPNESLALDAVVGDFNIIDIDKKQRKGTIKVNQITDNNEDFKANYERFLIELVQADPRYSVYFPFVFENERCLRSGYFLTNEGIVDIPEIKCEQSAESVLMSESQYDINQ